MILTEQSVLCKNEEEVHRIAQKNKLSFVYNPVEGAAALDKDKIVAYYWKQQSGNAISDFLNWINDDN